MLKKIKNWYNGKQVRIDNGEPETIGVMAVLPEYETVFHWSAIVARKTVSYVKKEYWRLLAFFVAVAGLVAKIFS